MALEHTNRQGETYYLLQGKTKTGKPKYYVSRKPDGVPVDEMPEGFEFYENPMRGLVSVRRIRPSNVLPLERAFLEQKMRELTGIEVFRVEIDADRLVVYTPEMSSAEANFLVRKLAGDFPIPRERLQVWAEGQRLQPMLAFSLVDEEKRLFRVARWCFLGSIDGWFPMSSGSKSLERQAERFLPHLEKESFFELF